MTIPSAFADSSLCKGRVSKASSYETMQLLFRDQLSPLSSLSTILLYLCLLVAPLVPAGSIRPPVVSRSNNETFPAVFVFGDSIVDPGNNNGRRTLAKANFRPYGRDLNGGEPTGRFSNGKIPTDFLVQKLGIKEFLPAYRDPNLQPQDLLTGVSFASGGAGYDHLTDQIEGATSLLDQLEFYKEYKAKLEQTVGKDTAEFILSKSLFVVVAGSNDLANTYYTAPIRRIQYNVLEYTNRLVSFASAFLQEMYNLGARRIGVFGVPPLGCLPVERTLQGGPEGECVEAINQGVELFNSKLSLELQNLEALLSHARFVYMDTYNPLLRLIQNPSANGFEVVEKGCCGTGKIEASILCNYLNPFTCEDASKYIFWDSFHPTERAYQLLNSQIIQEPIINRLLCRDSPC